MKRILPILKVLILFLMVPGYLHAYDFEDNGIYYNIIKNTNTVRVTYRVYTHMYTYEGDITIPEYVSYDGVKYEVVEIDRAAFGGNVNLKSVKLPKSIVKIWYEAFMGCSSLSTITIPNSVTEIGIQAFEDCKNLVSIDLPNSITAIDSRVFQDCKNLVSIDLPNSIKRIGSNAFSGCDKLSHISIPNNVTSIGNGAFENCISLNNLTLPNDLEVINSSTFSGCTDLTNINIPPKITSIGYRAFEGCERLSNVDIHDGITTIDMYAFSRCIGLKSIILPNSLKAVKGSAFEGCKSLEYVESQILTPFNPGYNCFSGLPVNSVLCVPYGTKEKYQELDWKNYFNDIVEKNDGKSVNLSISVMGEGSVLFEGTTIRGKNSTFNVKVGTNATITFNPDNGYRIKSMKVNGTDVKSSVSDNQYTVNNISANTTVEVEFEAIPVKTHILSYVVDEEMYKTYEIEEGAVIMPETEPTKEGYSFSGWSEVPATMPGHDVTVKGTFTKMEGQMTVDGISYEVVSFGNHTVVVANGEYGQTLEVPATVNKGNDTWTVTGLKDGALDQCEKLAAVIWNPSAMFNARVNNPNLLLYVKDKAYASFGVNNVIVNDIAESIELTDDTNGNDFYCPRVFKAKNIIYKHNYQMETGFGDSRGWETIVLPFDVQKYTHATKGELESFTTWSMGSNKKPFWLFELTASGYKDVAGIKANTPYIISMPNNKQYEQQYQIPGIVTFSASDVEVQKSDNLTPVSYQGRSFVPNYTNKSDDNCLPLNVSNNYVTNPGKDISGSKFVKGLRAVHPFEAYMITTDNTRSIDVMDGLTTAIRDIRIVNDESSVIKVYDTRGVLLKIVTNKDDVRNGLKAGVYIVNGKKMIIK